MADIDFLRALARRRRPVRLIVLVIILLGLVLGEAILRLQSYYGKVLQEANGFRQQRAAVQKELASFRGALEKNNQLTQQEKTLQEKKALMKSLESGKRWSEVLKDLAARVPASVTLTEVQVVSDQLLVRGISPDFTALARFEQQLGKSPLLPKIDLKYAVEDGQSGSYNFEFQSPVQKVGAKQ